MRLGHHFYLMVLALLKYHQNMPVWSMSPFDVHVKRAIMSQCHFLDRKTNKLLLSICLPV